MTDKYAALKQAAQIVAVGDWLYHDRQKLDHVGGGFLAIDGKESVFCLNSAVGGIKKGNDVVKYIAAANPSTMLALLNELEAAEKLIDTLRQDKDKVIDMSVERVNKLLSRAEAAEKRVAEVERKEQHSERQSVIDALAGSGDEWSDIEEYMQKWDAERASAAGKGEAS